MKRYKWLKRNLSEAQNGFFFLLYLPFSLAFYASITPWSLILTSNKATLRTPVMQSCKAGLLGQLGSGNPPMVQSSVSGTPHPPPKQLLEHILCPTLPWARMAAFLFQHIANQHNLGSLAAAATQREPPALRSPRAAAEGTRTCSALSTGRASLVPGARDFSCGTDMKAVTSCGLPRAKLIPGFQCRSKADGCFSTNEVIPLPF